MRKTDVIIATGNPGKISEIHPLFEDMPLAFSSLRDHWNPPLRIPETGSSFRDNAILKADWVFSRTGVWTLADDSGLEVDCLGGEPGVRSARYAGQTASDEENNATLLHAMDSVAGSSRGAQFRCVIVLRIAEARLLTGEGICRGEIVRSPRGAGGFGYDPLFVPEGFDKTFAELDAEQKQRISHRGRALRDVRRQLRNYLDWS